MNHKPSTINQKSGFTLLEMSIVLLIVASMIGGGLVFFNEYRDRNKRIETEQKMATIVERLKQYAKTFKRLPCPGDITLAPTSSEYGIAIYSQILPTDCGIIGGNNNDVSMGLVPFISLGLPAEYAIDGWGNRFRYVIPSALALSNSLNTFTTGGFMTGNYKSLTASISAGYSGAIIILMSHGENGQGARGARGQNGSPYNSNLGLIDTNNYQIYQDTGAAREALNSYGMENFYSGPVIISAPINGFDDIVMGLSYGGLMSND